MKILHTSDWHLGKYLNGISRHNEQVEVLKEITSIAETEDVNVVIISGDIFDTFNPPVESAELFYKTVKNLSANGRRAVIAIAGNHDSPDRIEAPDPLARECGIILAGFPNSIIPPFKLDCGLELLHSEPGFFTLKVPHIEYNLRVLFTPYANEFRLKTFLGKENEEEELRSILSEKWQSLSQKFCDSNGVNILMAHLLFIKCGDPVPEEPEDEKPILHAGGAQLIYTDSIPEEIQYTALGHLHRKQTVVQGHNPVVYSGSPLEYSFSEAYQTKFVKIAEIFPGSPANLKSIPLQSGKKLKRIRAEGIEDAITKLGNCPDAYVELTLATENYLTTEDRKKLSMVHENIVTIIPEIRDSVNMSNSVVHKKVDPAQDLESLFVDYFQYTKGQHPNDEILSLFKEVLSENDTQ